MTDSEKKDLLKSIDILKAENQKLKLHINKHELVLKRLTATLDNVQKTLADVSQKVL